MCVKIEYATCIQHADLYPVAQLRMVTNSTSEQYYFNVVHAGSHVTDPESVGAFVAHEGVFGRVDRYEQL